jgi:hypothetical protein
MRKRLILENFDLSFVLLSIDRDLQLQLAFPSFERLCDGFILSDADYARFG